MTELMNLCANNVNKTLIIVESEFNSWFASITLEFLESNFRDLVTIICN